MPSSALMRPVVAPPPRLAEIAVLDRDTGERLPVYWHDGQRWVAGAPGHRYAVSVRNRTAGRILTVVSVDGVNAVSGETAGWDQRGYVLSPWVSYDVLGWRKSSSTVAGFVFTALADSYAARTGRAADVGVIGVAVFRENPPPPPPVSLSGGDILSRSDAVARALEAPAAPAPAPDAAAAADAPMNSLASAGAAARSEAARARQRLGTGHGQSETSQVSLVDFERASEQPDEVITIRYDRYERLVALGVIPAPAPLSLAPHAFPGSVEPGFVPDPPSRD